MSSGQIMEGPCRAWQKQSWYDSQFRSVILSVVWSLECRSKSESRGACQDASMVIPKRGEDSMDQPSTAEEVGRGWTGIHLKSLLAVGMESEGRKRKSKFYNSFGLRNCIVSFPVEGNIWGRVIISRGY